MDKMKWEKPSLRDLGSAMLEYTKGSAPVSCEGGSVALTTCLSGGTAGATAQCAYGGVVTQ